MNPAYHRTPEYLWFLVAGALLCVGLAARAWQRSHIPGARGLAAMLCGTAIWSLGYVLEVTSIAPEAKLLWAKLQYVGAAGVPVAFYSFASRSAGRDQAWLRRIPGRLLLLGIPASTLALVLTNERHALIWRTVSVEQHRWYTVLSMEHGAWFWVHALFSYVLMFIASQLLIATALRSPPVYRAQVVSVLIAVVVPWLGNLAYVLRLNPLAPLDPTPFAFAVSGLSLGWGMLRLRMLSHLLGIVPVARDAIVESMTDGIIVLDHANQIVDVNNTAARLIGLPRQDVIGRATSELVSGDSLLDPLTRWQDCGSGPVRTEVGTGLGAERRYYDLLISPLGDGGPPAHGRLAVFREITERKQAEEALVHQALFDQLTGLPNRNHLLRKLTALTGVGQEGAAGGPHALILMDLNGFREVNDTFGHRSGDDLLQQVGNRLREALRAVDFIARLGGDEFCVLLAGANRRAALTVAGRLLRALVRPFVVADYPLHITASAGIALCPEHGECGDTLLRRAEVAMYAAKDRRSQGGLMIYSEDTDPYSPDRLVLLNELRNAISDDQLLLHYQPQIECQSGRVVGVEALVRWNHPRLGLIGPAEFVPLVEASGSIGALSKWVLGAAVRECHAFREAGLDLPVAVNLSAHDICDRDVIGHIPALLQESGLEPRSLEIEVTESALIMDNASSARLLMWLSKLGVRLAIDDFGTGYSSLVRLAALPVDAIKIDKAFVKAICRPGSSAAIVRSTIDLGHALGLRVVAEGVETARTWRLLTAMGCDSAQGYHLCRPLTAHELVVWMARRAQSQRKVLEAAAL